MAIALAVPSGSVVLPEEDELELLPPSEPPDRELLREIEELAETGPPAPGIPSRRLRILLIAAPLAAIVYVTWWIVAGPVGSPVVFGLLAAAEAFSITHLLGFWWTLWNADRRAPPTRIPALSVDAFVTTCGEPYAVVEATLRAVVAMRGPHRTVLLDDAGRPEMRALAERLGADYLARGTRRGAKAGNLNFGLAHSSSEVVAAFDADHRPRPEFLERTLPYLADPGMALVQTPQYYADSREAELARNAYLQQAVFFGPICRGKSGLGAAFCCGTGYLFRRRALEEVGGFEETSVVEDVVTSMRIHRLGWRSAYYPYVVVEGLGPPTLRGYFRQQFRWARGTVGALLAGEPLRRGFTRAQRVQYLLGTTYFLSGLATLVYISMPLLYVFGGWSAFAPGAGSFIFAFAPYILITLLAARAALGDELRVEHLRFTYGAFPVYSAASIAALLHLRTRFEVTGSERNRRGVPRLAWVTVVAAALTAVAIVAAPFVRELNSRTFTQMAWGAVNLTLMSGIVAAVAREATPGLAGRLLRPLTQPARRIASSLPEHIIGSRAPRETPGELAHPRLKLAGIVGIGLLVRLAVVPLQGMRLDESIAWRQASASLPHLWHELATADTHPPLAETLEHFVIRLFGDSPLALRSISIVSGTACIALIYVVASRLISRRGALVAAAAAAVCPILVWHSAEGRQYPLLLAFELASVALLMNAMERGRAWRWAAYSVATAACFYTHYLGVVVLAIHAAYFVLAPRGERRRIVPLAAAGAGVVLLLSPWVAYMVVEGAGAVSHLSNGVPVPSPPTGVLALLSTMLAFGSVQLAGYLPQHDLAVASAFAIGMVPALPIVLVLSRTVSGWLRRRTAMLLFAWALLPVAAVYVMSHWKPEILLQRYAMLAAPGLLMLLGAACARMVRPYWLAIATPLLVFGAFTLVTQLSPRTTMHEDFRGAVAQIRPALQPRDGVLVTPGFASPPLHYYLRRRIDEVAVPAAGRAPDLEPLLRGYAGRTVWLVSFYPWRFDPHRVTPRYLGARLRLVSRRHFGPNMELSRYAVPSALGQAARPVPTAPGRRPGSRGTRPGKPGRN